MRMRMRPQTLRWCILGMSLCAVLLMVFLPQMHQSLPEDDSPLQQPGVVRVQNSQLFQQDKSGSLSLLQTKFLDFTPEFKHTKGQKPRIPQILHQVWDTQNIPELFHKWVREWLVINPGWEYWLWTLEDARALLKESYPEHLALFDSYPSTIHRADAMRYFILYTYGGVYMDLDMQPLRPLQNWTYNYNCFISQENYEHTYVVRGETEPNVVNGVLACRAKHPFFLEALNSLGEHARKYFGDFVRATGPMFLNDVFKEYLNSSHEVTDKVTVVPPKFFLPTFDRSESETISFKCFPTRTRELPVEGQTLCRELLSRRYRNEPGPEAYTDHHWVHANMFDNEWKRRNSVSIFALIPEAKSPFLTGKDS